MHHFKDHSPHGLRLLDRPSPTEPLRLLLTTLSTAYNHGSNKLGCY